jgi:hypothetical protein
MGFKTTVTIMVEMEVPGDQSGQFMFDRYVDVKNGACIRAKTVQAMTIETLAVKHKDPIINESMNVFRTLLKSAIGDEPKIKISKSRNHDEGLLAEIMSRERPADTFRLCMVSYRINKADIYFPGGVTIKLADPDCVNQLYTTIHKIMDRIDDSGGRAYYSSALEAAKLWKGPGVTV